MGIKVKNYLHHLKDRDLSEPQKLECLEIIRAMFQEAIEAAHGTHSVQLCSEEKDLQSPDQTVESKSLSKNFIKTTIAKKQRTVFNKTVENKVQHAGPR